jgi:plastocyanin
MKKTVSILWAVFVILGFLGTDAISATVNVSMGDSFFQPRSITINVGDTVVWTNNGGLLHTATSGSGCNADMFWDSGTLFSGQSFQRVFDQAGTFPYFCTFHCSVGMTGTVTVNPLAQVIPSPSGQQFFFFTALAGPALSADPFQARPVGLGPVASGGAMLTVTIGLEQFAQPVDIYAAFIQSADPSAVVNVVPGPAFQTFSLMEIFGAFASGQPPAGAVPLMMDVSTPVNMVLFADVPVSMITPGRYDVFLVAASSGSLSDFYLWRTEFTVSP